MFFVKYTLDETFICSSIWNPKCDKWGRKKGCDSISLWPCMLSLVSEPYSEIEKQNFKSCRTNASGFDLRVDKVEWFLIICDK